MHGETVKKDDSNAFINELIQLDTCCCDILSPFVINVTGF